MRKIRFILLSSLILMIAGCGNEKGLGDKASKMNALTGSEEILIYYSCPMDSHSHIHSREAGSCSECGMDMVKGVITTQENMDFWGCPMEAHAHVRTDSPGTCEDCGMKLKPMRLVKS